MRALEVENCEVEVENHKVEVKNCEVEVKNRQVGVKNHEVEVKNHEVKEYPQTSKWSPLTVSPSGEQGAALNAQSRTPIGFHFQHKNPSNSYSKGGKAQVKGNIEYRGEWRGVAGIITSK